MLYITCIICLLLNCKICSFTVFDIKNSTNLFEYYKSKYNKTYDGEDDVRLENFVNNLNKIDALNRAGNHTKYMMNKYGDMDTNELDQHYSATILPYDTFKQERDPNDNGLRQANGKVKHQYHKKKTQGFDKIPVYDLYDSEDLFEKYKKQYHKVYKDELINEKHFLRFVKTLVEINRNNALGNSDKKLDEISDMALEPYQYTFRRYVLR